MSANFIVEAEVRSWFKGTAASRRARRAMAKSQS